eukprot:g2278.t1
MGICCSCFKESETGGNNELGRLGAKKDIHLNGTRSEDKKKSGGLQSNTATETQNPLTALTGIAEEEEKKVDPEEMKKKIESIYRTYNPEKLSDPSFLESMFNTYKGHEMTLYGQLLALYGPEPGAEGGPAPNASDSEENSVTL